MFRKKLKIVVFDCGTGKYRNTAVPFEYRFQWIAENAWADLERMRQNLGFNQWYHMIVPIDFDVECPYEAI
jgi:hypothetical protein